MDDCVARGLDCTNGGAVYNTTGLVAVGTATVADSLYAIKRLVYDEKKLTLGELTEILRNNFEGQEYLRQFILNRFEKFGNDQDCVDRLAVGITDAFADELEKHHNSRGGAFWGALYSVSAQVGLGNVCCATPDGRLDGLPLSDGLTPMYGMDRNGPTAVLASLSKIHQKRFPNGIIVNQRMSGSLFKTPEGREKMAQLLREEVEPAVLRALKIEQDRSPLPLDWEQDVPRQIATACGGDVRKAINAVELLCRISLRFIEGQKKQEDFPGKGSPAFCISWMHRFLSQPHSIRGYAF